MVSSYRTSSILFGVLLLLITSVVVTGCSLPLAKRGMLIRESEDEWYFYSTTDNFSASMSPDGSVNYDSRSVSILEQVAKATAAAATAKETR